MGSLRIRGGVTVNRHTESKRWGIHAVLAAGALVMIGPFLWMVITSFKTLGESTRMPPALFPNRIIWENYADVTRLLPFFDFYKNTVLMAGGVMLGQLIFCSMAGYAFARIPFPGKNVIFVLFLSVLMIPPQAFLIPQFLIMKELGWLNTMQGLIAPGLFSAFGTFLMRQFFMSMPMELEEAARLDGCTHFGVYRRIMLPLAKPGLVALAITTVITSWKSLLWPLIVNNSIDRMPLSAGLAYLQGQYITNYPVLMAAGVLALIPVIAIFLLLQKHFIEGLTFTGLK
jgi:multiple sugar transport system permease protein